MSKTRHVQKPSRPLAAPSTTTRSVPPTPKGGEQEIATKPRPQSEPSPAPSGSIAVSSLWHLLGIPLDPRTFTPR